MANVEHRNLTGASLHEPKGAATAADKTILVANGAGGTAWQQLPHGGFYYFNATGEALAGGADLSTTPVLVNPSTSTTTSTSAMEFTVSADARLTYTGSPTRHFHIAGDLCSTHSAGVSRDIIYQIYKNGVAVDGSRKIRSSATGSIGSLALHYDMVLATNDYIELYAYTSTGTANTFLLNQVYFFAIGMPGT